MLSEKLINWYEIYHRVMPWRETKDPYAIWLSEIILQQTQVAQGTPYYHKFITRYPTIQSLAKANEDEVLKLWQGLGYYSRARNLLATARFIQTELNGVFPNSYKEVLMLKGIGAYTAAAIASFAFNEAKAVVDGNVIRVISRLFQVTEPVDKASGKALIQNLADQLLDKALPAIFNQAIMELGSQICKPKDPNCVKCPIQEHCLSYKQKNMLMFPFKLGKTKSQKVNYTFIVPISLNKKLIVEKRKDHGIWKNMFTFPLIEEHIELTHNEIVNLIQGNFGEFTILHTYSCKHILSHRQIFAKFYLVELKENEQFKKNNTFEVEFKSLEKTYAMPRIISRYLENDEVKTILNKHVS